MMCTTAWIGERVHWPPAPAGLRVFGVTSRGIFLVSTEKKVVFLSSEPFRGPLTLNLTGGPLTARLGETVHLGAWSLDFPSGDRVDLSTARAWQPPAPPAAQNLLAARRELLRAVALEILSRSPRAGLAPLLGPMFDLPFPPLGQELRAAAECLQALRAGAALAPALTKLLGLGRGLTPSGDDFIAGYLLARVRSRPAPAGDEDIPARLADAAFTLTTTLSASLIESAACGSADERLLAACDALLTGREPAADVYTHLSGYGSSSGLDAFTGITACWLYGDALAT